MKVTLIDDQETVDIGLERIEKISKYIGDKFDSSKDSELNIIFIEKKTIKALNKKHRDIDKATDVLSFSYVDNDGFKAEDGFEIVGEIYISPEVAYENSKSIEGSWDINCELVLLIIHGILHIYDYDHEMVRERIDMEAAQKSLFNDVSKNFDI